MRYEDEPLPTLEESKFETEKRLKIVEGIRPQLERFCEAVILAGSMGYGKNYSVRNESDIDLIVLVNREESKNISNCALFKMTEQVKEGLGLFLKGEVDHFSIREEIEGVEMQYHFWDKEAHFNAELFRGEVPKVYNIFRMDESKLVGIDFSGRKRSYILPEVKRMEYGLVHDYPAFFIDEGCFVPRQPLLNLITDPDILFTKDPQLLSNIDKIWENLTKRLVEESLEGVDLGKRNILFSVYGYWNLSLDSKKKVETRIASELRKLGDY